MPTVNLTLTGQAFASVNDTNVTLTLGGTPLTALLKGVSITAGWTGQLSVARGGTGLGALGTANQLLRVNALGTALEYFTPSYGTGTVTSFAFTDSTGITSTVLNATTTPTLSLSLTSAAVGLGNVENTALSTWAGSTNLVTLGAAVTGTGSLTLGTSSSVAGTLVLKNATNAFTQTIRGTNPSASIIYDLPTTAPTAGQVLQSTAPVAGVATLSWATASSGITVGTTTITSGTSLRIPYNLAGVYQEQANFTIGSVATGVLDVPVGLAVGGTQILKTSNSLFLGTGTPAIAATIACTFIGHNSGLNAITSNSCTFVGHGAGALTGASIGCVYIGYNNMVVSSPALTGSITMGYEVAATASHQGVLGGNNSTGYVDNWYFNGVTHTSAYSVNLRACGGSGTNNAGANITIAGGRGTGTAAGGNNVEQTSVKGSSGTTLQSLTDRHNIVGKYVDITGGAATTFGQLALATSGTVSGGIVVYVIEANDGTDYQSLSGTLRYDVVNKAGTLTVVYSDTQNGTGACSAGTLTATVTATTSGTNVLFQANAVSSLSETVLRVSFQVLNNFGVATITAA